LGQVSRPGLPAELGIQPIYREAAWRAGFLAGVLIGFGSAIVWYFALRLLAALGGKP
jgi:hypothetical protein